MHICRLIRDGFNDGFYNMAVDEAVADAVEKGASPSTLRLYGWKSPTLSIGYSQRTDKKIDTGYCRKNKIDIVLRPTGGRAVLHDKEVTYSLASPKNNPLFPDNISGTYKAISVAMTKGLSFLDIDANISTLRTPHSELRTSSCFATTSQYEITVNGKKLIGSAQRRFKNSFLQHGSIPLENHHDKLALCLGFKKGHKSKKFVKLLKEKSIALNELNERVYSYNEVVDALMRGFEGVLKIQFKISPLTEYELKLAKKLYERKITSP
ncbi:MAG: lipoate--protein ligase family protein [Nitrospinae bacterium]|nr:lipoate--protein ligase family protein [Nitrospinota bacterium]